MDEEDDDAELGDSSAGSGVVGGHGYSERRLRLHAVVAWVRAGEAEREREREERIQEGAWRRLVASGMKQAGRRWLARGDHAPFVLLARGGRRQGRWGCAGLASWAAQSHAAGKVQVGFSILFFFSIFLTFVYGLVKY